MNNTSRSTVVRTRVFAFGTGLLTISRVIARTTRTGAAPLSRALSRAQERYDDLVGPRLSVKEQMFFVKRLSFLTRAGVPILESLIMLSEQTPSRRFARIIESVITDVENGYTLSRSLARFPGIFGDFGINIVKIGESSGTLSQNLEYLADELKKSQNLRRKVIGAFIYPSVIGLATLAITGFLMLYLFPRIMPIFTSLHMKLPLTTRIVIALSSFLSRWGLLVLVLTVLVVSALAVFVKKNTHMHMAYDYVSIKAPLIGEMMRNYNLANATRTLGLLLKSGITVAQALPLTADTTKNLLYKKEYRALAEGIARGERISDSLVRTPLLFPTVLTQMVAVGERSGTLADTLIYLSEMYETEVEEFTKNLSSLIEPAMMILMGLIVGFIAISIITPIYGITQNLHP